MKRNMMLIIVAASLIGVTLVCVTLLMIFGSHDTQALITSGLLALGGTVGPLVMAWLGRDRDHDGVPDILQGGDDEG